MRRLSGASILAGILLFVPSLAYAQATLAGVVRDASEAVLPGETPVVDTQDARRQAVLSNDVINTLPATRSYGALLTAIPGLQVDNTANRGAQTTPFMTFFTANGGRANEGRMMIDGLNVA